MFAQADGNMAVGIVKSRIRVAGCACALQYDIFCRMHGHFRGKFVTFFGESDIAADRVAEIFGDGIQNAFFDMRAQSVADIDLFACKCDFHDYSLQNIIN